MSKGSSNGWCQVLDIAPPSVESVANHREAGPFSLMLVALLERGEPMTLEAVAERLVEAGALSAETALTSLRRSRPARAPVYRHGDFYHLDPHDDELDLWIFRLGLRPPAVPPLRLVRPEPEPLPGEQVPLDQAELREGLGGLQAHSPWSAQRLALAVLDGHGGTLPPDRLVAWLDAHLYGRQPVRPSSIRGWRTGAVLETDDGSWQAAPGHPALLSARKAVRDRIAKERRRRERGPDPVVQAVERKRYEAKQARREAELAGLDRVLVHAYPAAEPRAVALVDVNRWTLETYDLGDDGASDAVRESLEGYGLVAGWQVRPQLQGLGFDPGPRRLAELEPPQKTARLTDGGRPQPLTQELLIRSCCNIERPLVAPKRLARALARGEISTLLELLAADARSLSLYYQYGRLHGHLRVLWRGWQTVLPAPWANAGDLRLHDLVRSSRETGRRLEMVIGQVEDWSDPWGESVIRRVGRGGDLWSVVLEDWDDWILDSFEIQLARLVD